MHSNVKARSDGALIMALRNRVDPQGDFHATNARGGLMGNRGILHDENKQIRRPHAHQNWVACALNFKGRKREIMAPGRYTELFFLDEATAFSAGHRPCAECRRGRYNAFTSAWRQVYGVPAPGRSLSQAIDKALHASRIDRQRNKITFSAPVETLPDGTMFRFDDGIVLVRAQEFWNWSLEGYTSRSTCVVGDVEVLTPQPLLDVFRTGFVPLFHSSMS